MSMHEPYLLFFLLQYCTSALITLITNNLSLAYLSLTAIVSPVACVLLLIRQAAQVPDCSTNREGTSYDLKAFVLIGIVHN